MIPNNIFLISLFLPLFSALFLKLFYSKTGVLNTFVVYTSLYVISLVTISVYYFLFFTNNLVVYINIYSFMNVNGFIINFDFLFDNLTVVMSFVVVTISFFVTVFSYWYMRGDPQIFKFIFFLNLFSFFMLILVCANNLILIFVGWEGIGLLSYFLINFWSTRLAANRSALKAVIVNKVGDCFFYFFIVFYFFCFETFSLYDVKVLISNVEYFSMANYEHFKFLTFTAVFLLFAAMAKSAQIFFHVWLPDAMEGPTPVSALLHAATMVTAGIYILIKFNWLFFFNENIFFCVTIIGLVTNLLASLTAIFQFDMKKIIAYSTASQLGLIFMSFGIYKHNLALFHIFNHAFFKALLFILAGIIIHYAYNNQDLRFIKKINDGLFLVYFSFIIASLTLVGLPFLSAFYSKEAIIQYSFLNIQVSKNVIFIFLLISVLTTIIYSFKLINFVFINKNFLVFKSSNKIYFNDLKFSFVSYVVVSLIVFSIFVGYLNHFYFQNEFFKFSSVFFFLPYFEHSAQILYIDFSFFFILSFLLFVFVDFSFEKKIAKYNLEFSFYKNIVYLFNKKFLFDNLYNFFFNVCLVIFYIILSVVDKKFVEFKIITFCVSTLSFIKKTSYEFVNFKIWTFYIVIFIVAIDIYLLIVAPNVFLIMFFLVLIFDILHYINKKNKK